MYFRVIFFSNLLTHEGSHREVYRDFQPSLTSSAGSAKACLGHRFRSPPAYTFQLLTLHQHRANNQYTRRLIKSRVSSSTQLTLKQSPIQVVTELNVAWFQWLYENWYFQVDKSLRPNPLLYVLFNSKRMFIFGNRLFHWKQTWTLGPLELSYGIIRPKIINLKNQL